MYGYQTSNPKKEDESIYALISRPEAEASRPARYRSRYPPDAPPTASTFRRTSTSQTMVSNIAGNYYDIVPPTRKHALFGPKEASEPCPTEFLKKGTRTSALSSGTTGSFHYADRRKEPLSPDALGACSSSSSSASAEDAVAADAAAAAAGPNSGGKRNTNYILANTMAAVRMRPPARVVAERDVDYTKKPGFGKVPAYLSRVNADIAREKDYIAAVTAERTRAAHLTAQGTMPQVAPLAEEERQALLAALKTKWGQVNAEYQKLTHLVMIASTGTLRKKEECEAQLVELEHSIEKLSKKTVYVCEDY